MRSVLIGLAIGSILAVCLGDTVGAHDSTLRQFITAVDCDHTTVETGSGVVNNIDCPYFPPTVENVVVQRSSIKVTGIYDAVHMTRLRVVFRGVWYEYGVDAVLTTNGNVWRIELVDDDAEIEPGDYNIAVQSTDENGVVQQDIGSVVIPAEPIPVNPGGNNGGAGVTPTRPGIIIPGAPNTGAAGLSVSALALVIFVLPLLIRWIKKRSS